MSSRSDACAIVPVKALGEAKSRLAGVLSPQARRRLVLAMLDDVLAALAATPAISQTVVVSPDAEVAAAARGRHASVCHESAPTSLNGAIRLGLHQGPIRADARCLILPADVPLVTAGEIGTLLAHGPGGERPGVVITPSHDGGGTNALVLTDRDVMGPSFGTDSFKRHLELAEALHQNPRVVCLPGLGFDIDTPDDLRRLSQVERYAWLAGEWLGAPPTFACQSA